MHGNRWRAAARGLSGEQGGVAAIEFAIIAAVLMTLVLGALEFGLIIYTYAAAENASRDVSRQLATNELSASNASAKAVSELPTWLQSSSALAVNVSQTTPGTQSTNVFTVSIRFPASSAAPLSFLGFAAGGLTLDAHVSMQQEPTS